MKDCKADINLKSVEQILKVDFNNLEQYWLDKTTFIMVFGYQNIDNEDEEYHIESEYHTEDSSYHFIRVYNHEIMKANFTLEEENEIKKLMYEYMNEQ